MFRRIVLPSCFLITEGILYYFILAGGNLQIAASFVSIVLCFLFATLYTQKENALKTAALACTVCADFFLVVCSPIQRLWGMVFFLAAQTFYAISLYLQSRSKRILSIRLLLIAVIEIVAACILRSKTDALAVISVCYYANLFMNIVESSTQFQKSRIFPVALVLFILCDTVVGLQVAAEGYLPIAEGSVLYQLLFSGFNLAWFFYLPSQVLIALSQTKRNG